MDIFCGDLLSAFTKPRLGYDPAKIGGGTAQPDIQCVCHGADGVSGVGAGVVWGILEGEGELSEEVGGRK